MCRKSNIDHLCRPLKAFLKTLYSICVCGCCDFRIHQESDGRTFREVDVAAASAAICAVCTQLCQLSRNERSADEQKKSLLVEFGCVTVYKWTNSHRDSAYSYTYSCTADLVVCLVVYERCFIFTSQDTDRGNLVKSVTYFQYVTAIFC